MKVWVDISDVVEVDVNVMELMAALPGDLEPDTVIQVFNMVNRCVVCIRAIPDSMIQKLNPEQRQFITSALEVQASRYRSTPPVPPPPTTPNPGVPFGGY